MADTSRAGRGARRTLCGAAMLALVACAPQYQNHGYIPPEEELQQIQVGQDTRDTVREKIGTPASSGVLGDGGFYYVRMRQRAIGPFAPREIDREVVAISFAPSGVVQNVERFGMERGRVIEISRRVTDSPTSNKSFIKQLLGNLGRFNPAGLGG